MISAQRGWIGRLGEVALVRGFDPALGLAPVWQRPSQMEVELPRVWSRCMRSHSAAAETFGSSPSNT